jgi:hypothetical protein
MVWLHIHWTSKVILPSNTHYYVTAWRTICSASCGKSLSSYGRLLPAKPWPFLPMLEDRRPRERTSGRGEKTSPRRGAVRPMEPNQFRGVAHNEHPMMGLEMGRGMPSMTDFSDCSPLRGIKIATNWQNYPGAPAVPFRDRVVFRSH